MRRWALAVAVVTGVAVALPVGSGAATMTAPCTHFADSGAAPGGGGGATDPVRSVPALLRLLQPGDTGCLAAAEFVGPVTIREGGTRANPVTLRSTPGGRARIVGQLWIARSASDVVVSHLDLDGSTTDGAPSPQVNGRRVTIADNEITNDHTGICLILGGSFARYGRARDVVVERNRIHDCGRLPATGHDHGIYVEGARRIVIKENAIYRNADWGIHLYPDARDVVVEHNVVYGNGAGVIVAGDRAHASSDVRIEANIVAASSRGNELSTYWDGPVGTGNVAIRNCVWNGRRDAVGDHHGLEVRDNVVRRPRFADARSADFRPAPTDPCRRTGRSPA